MVIETIKIYFSGETPLSSRWQKQIQDAIKYGGYDYEKKVLFYNPIDYYNLEVIQHNSEREVMEFDLYNLRKSDLVVVNFIDSKNIVSAMELMLAKELRIPVVAFGVNNKEINPWLLECCTRVCDNIREVVEYIVDFYLN